MYDLMQMLRTNQPVTLTTEQLFLNYDDQRSGYPSLIDLQHWATFYNVTLTTQVINGQTLYTFTPPTPTP